MPARFVGVTGDRLTSGRISQKMLTDEDVSLHGANRSNPESSQSQGLHWVATINNFIDQDLAMFIANRDSFTYYVHGAEIGASGTRHLQCYLVFKNKKRFNYVKKLFPRAWIQVKSKFSTPQQAADYCKKDGNFIEYGELPQPQYAAGGQATADKWQQAKTAAKEGKLDEAPPDIYVRYYNALKKIEIDERNKVKPRTLDWKKSPNQWYYGVTGTGRLLLFLLS